MFFVLGAQKAGTTWLHTYLSAHPQVSTGPIKEYSYFGYFHPSMTRGNAALPKGQFLRRLMAEASLRRRVGLSRGYLSSMLQAFRQGPIYKDLLARHDGDGPLRAFGDISPKYSLLGRSAFGEMAALHPKTKFVFIMRDPAERLWSQIRMRLARRQKHVPDPGQISKMAALSLMSGRSDYARTMDELEARVPKDDILYLFYETLFTDASMQRLCDHLGIDFAPGQYQTRVFQGRPDALPDEVRREFRTLLAAQYNAVKQRFASDLPPWSF
ncbi:MAG: sulfotransferase [Rhodobacteraceae bacterium]|nr:sulfotransferase [Paracoccaceae bacterium]